MTSSIREITMPSLGEPLVESGDPGESIALVTTEADWIATLTFGASTVRLIGPERTFAEPTAAYAVRHDTWVRTLPEPFSGSIDRAWFDNALEANRSGLPDILAISMQYLRDAPLIYDGALQIAGAATYGPLDSQGKRQERSDFNDYLGGLLRLHADDLGLSAKHGWPWPWKHSAVLPTFRRSSGDSAPILPDLRVGTGSHRDSKHACAG
jgi:hypothetical protein